MAPVSRSLLCCHDCFPTEARSHRNGFSVVRAAAPLVHGSGALGIKQAAVVDLGIQKPVVAAFHPLFHLSIKPGQSLWKQGLLGGAGLQFKACEAIGTGFERL